MLIYENMSIVTSSYKRCIFQFNQLAGQLVNLDSFLIFILHFSSINGPAGDCARLLLLRLANLPCRLAAGHGWRLLECKSSDHNYDELDSS